jgi:hypothetical protein
MMLRDLKNKTFGSSFRLKKNFSLKNQPSLFTEMMNIKQVDTDNDLVGSETGQREGSLINLDPETPQN